MKVHGQSGIMCRNVFTTSHKPHNISLGAKELIDSWDINGNGSGLSSNESIPLSGSIYNRTSVGRIKFIMFL